MSDYRERLDDERWLRMLDDEYAPASLALPGAHDDFLGALDPDTRKGCDRCWMVLEKDGTCFYCDHGCWKCGGKISKHDNTCALDGEVTFRCHGDECHCQAHSRRVAA